MTKQSDRAHLITAQGFLQEAQEELKEAGFVVIASAINPILNAIVAVLNIWRVGGTPDKNIPLE